MHRLDIINASKTRGSIRALRAKHMPRVIFVILGSHNKKTILMSVRNDGITLVYQPTVFVLGNTWL